MLKQLGESYDPNYQYKRFNYRSNVDIDITKSTLLKVNIGGHVGAKREPRTDELWRKVLWSTPFSSPGIVDGKLISNIYSNRYISIGERSCPLDYYYNYGYNVDTDNVLNLDLALEQKLDFITPGLSMNIKGAYNTNYNVKASRTPSGADSMCTPIYLGSIETPGMDFWDPRFDRTIVYQTDGVSGLHEQMSYGEQVGRGRNWYGEFSLNYSRSFGDHDVSALFLYNQSKKYYPETKIDGKVFYMDIPTAYVGYVGRMTYAYKKRYMVDLNAGYNGSENFAPDKRFGFFPAVSAGWILSEEKFMKKQKVIDFLKLRASYGIVGNDNIGGTGDRFAYFTQFGSGNSYGFGPNGNLVYGIRETLLGSDKLTWEKSYKTNIGLEMMLWGKLNLTLDYYWERRKDILIQRSSLPSMAGFDASIYANMGEMDNKGVDANLEYQTRIGNKVGLRLFGNLTYSKNKIVFRDEPAMRYAYQKSEGTRYGEFYGYIAEGYFQSEEEIKKSPRQMRELAPGDIKYKDLNDDGVIDANDQCYLGKSWFPSWSYGMGFNINYHNFDLALFFQGVSDVSIMANGGSIDTGNGDWGASGVGIVPFTGMGLNPSNVITKALDRWTADNPRADAWYPRMTANATTNDNNYVNSTHWLKDGSYLRLKQASLGYTLENKKLMDKGIEYLYFYLSGQNLLTFSKFKLWDPELGSNGAKYPLSRMVTLGMRVSF